MQIFLEASLSSILIRDEKRERSKYKALKI